MGKGKPRHDPKKKQNTYGGRCPHYEGTWCHAPFNSDADVSKCKGNPHSCIKVKYKRLAIHRKDD